MITYQDTTSTPSGGNFCQKPVASSFWLISARFMLCRCLRNTVSIISPATACSAMSISLMHPSYRRCRRVHSASATSI
jgi:hypothetical protein